MDVDLMKAWFALYVVGVSLISLLDDNETFHLTAMKKIWGRSRGLLLHFLTNVAIPMLFALFYFCRGVVSLATF
ncbi:MAG: hypothetical protein OQK50_02535 [Deltaproteobacteria bacterium]|nr:hypothetical protein [Deltaproteobacteria bacterium]MCW8893797.1 hypothetical protein [Deltaproteobacteria bacterium]MCW9049193.1 hypothetical protein [Deltaproteobacteria bacterium]MEE4253022.1 hypothetical protein [Desulfuromusa sp.]